MRCYLSFMNWSHLFRFKQPNAICRKRTIFDLGLQWVYCVEGLRNTRLAREPNEVAVRK